MAHRQAYFPRLWPLLLLGAAVALPFGVIAQLLTGSVFAEIGVGVAVASVVYHVRFYVWRRRHPVLTRDEFVEMLRQSARWN